MHVYSANMVISYNVEHSMLSYDHDSDITLLAVTSQGVAFGRKL